MINDKILAKQLLNAVWNEDVEMAMMVIAAGGDPNWIFNGYPILIHAVFTRNKEMVMLLIEEGATQLEEAMAFVLDQGIGEMVLPFVFLGVIPKSTNSGNGFGPYPSRYCPIDYEVQAH